MKELLLYFIIFTMLFLYTHSIEYIENNDKYRIGKEDRPKLDIQAVLVGCNEKTNTVGEHLNGRVHILGFVEYDTDEARDVNHISGCRFKIMFVLKVQNTRTVRAHTRRSDDPIHAYQYDEYVSLDHVYDPITQRKTMLLNPYLVRILQSEPLQTYKLAFLQMVNAEATEETISKSDPAFPGCVDVESLSATKFGLKNKSGKLGPPCGSEVFTDTFTKGFCCTCDSQLSTLPPDDLKDLKDLGPNDRLVESKEYAGNQHRKRGHDKIIKLKNGNIRLKSLKSSVTPVGETDDELLNYGEEILEQDKKTPNINRDDRDNNNNGINQDVDMKKNFPLDIDPYDNINQEEGNNKNGINQDTEIKSIDIDPHEDISKEPNVNNTEIDNLDENISKTKSDINLDKDSDINHKKEVANQKTEVVSQNITVVDQNIEDANTNIEDVNKKIESAHQNTEGLIKSIGASETTNGADHIKQSDKDNIEVASRKIKDTNQNIEEVNQKIKGSDKNSDDPLKMISASQNKDDDIKNKENTTPNPDDPIKRVSAIQNIESANQKTEGPIKGIIRGVSEIIKETDENKEGPNQSTNVPIKVITASQNKESANQTTEGVNRNNADANIHIESSHQQTDIPIKGISDTQNIKGAVQTTEDSNKNTEISNEHIEGAHQNTEGPIKGVSASQSKKDADQTTEDANQNTEGVHQHKKSAEQKTDDPVKEISANQNKKSVDQNTEGANQYKKDAHQKTDDSIKVDSTVQNNKNIEDAKQHIENTHRNADGPIKGIGTSQNKEATNKKTEEASQHTESVDGHIEDAHQKTDGSVKSASDTKNNKGTDQTLVDANQNTEGVHPIKKGIDKQIDDFIKGDIASQNKKVDNHNAEDASPNITGANQHKGDANQKADGPIKELSSSSNKEGSSQNAEHANPKIENANQHKEDADQKIDNSVKGDVARQNKDINQNAEDANQNMERANQHKEDVDQKADGSIKELSDSSNKEGSNQNTENANLNVNSENQHKESADQNTEGSNQNIEGANEHIESAHRKNDGPVKGDSASQNKKDDDQNTEEANQNMEGANEHIEGIHGNNDGVIKGVSTGQNNKVNNHNTEQDTNQNANIKDANQNPDDHMKQVTANSNDEGANENMEDTDQNIEGVIQNNGGTGQNTENANKNIESADQRVEGPNQNLDDSIKLTTVSQIINAANQNKEGTNHNTVESKKGVSASKIKEIVDQNTENANQNIEGAKQKTHNPTKDASETVKDADQHIEGVDQYIEDTKQNIEDENIHVEDDNPNADVPIRSQSKEAISPDIESTHQNVENGNRNIDDLIKGISASQNKKSTNQHADDPIILEINNENDLNGDIDISQYNDIIPNSDMSGSSDIDLNDAVSTKNVKNKDSESNKLSDKKENGVNTETNLKKNKDLDDDYLSRAAKLINFMRIVNPTEYEQLVPAKVRDLNSNVKSPEPNGSETNVQIDSYLQTNQQIDNETNSQNHLKYLSKKSTENKENLAQNNDLARYGLSTPAKKFTRASRRVKRHARNLKDIEEYEKETNYDQAHKHRNYLMRGQNSKIDDNLGIPKSDPGEALKIQNLNANLNLNEQYKILHDTKHKTMDSDNFLGKRYSHNSRINNPLKDLYDIKKDQDGFEALQPFNSKSLSPNSDISNFNPSNFKILQQHVDTLREQDFNETLNAANQISTTASLKLEKIMKDNRKTMDTIGVILRKNPKVHNFNEHFTLPPKDLLGKDENSDSNLKNDEKSLNSINQDILNNLKTKKKQRTAEMEHENSNSRQISNIEDEGFIKHEYYYQNKKNPKGTTLKITTTTTAKPLVVPKILHDIIENPFMKHVNHKKRKYKVHHGRKDYLHKTKPLAVAKKKNSYDMDKLYDEVSGIRDSNETSDADAEHPAPLTQDDVGLLNSNQYAGFHSPALLKNKDGTNRKSDPDDIEIPDESINPENDIGKLYQVVAPDEAFKGFIKDDTGHQEGWKITLQRNQDGRDDFNDRSLCKSEENVNLMNNNNEKMDGMESDKRKISQYFNDDTRQTSYQRMTNDEKEPSLENVETASNERYYNDPNYLLPYDYTELLQLHSEHSNVHDSDPNCEDPQELNPEYYDEVMDRMLMDSEYGNDWENHVQADLVDFPNVLMKPLTRAMPVADPLRKHYPSVYQHRLVTGRKKREASIPFNSIITNKDISTEEKLHALKIMEEPANVSSKILSPDLPNEDSIPDKIVDNQEDEIEPHRYDKKRQDDACSGYQDTAHCMKFDDIWYSVYALDTPKLNHRVGIQVFEKLTTKGANIDNWIPLSESPLFISTIENSEVNDNNLAASYTLMTKMEDLIKSKDTTSPNRSLPIICSNLYLDSSIHKLLVPQPVPEKKLKLYPALQAGPPEYLVLDSTMIGPECGKAGVSFRSFAQARAKNRVDGPSCLINQPLQLWKKDKKVEKCNKTGNYLLKFYGEPADIQAVTNTTLNMKALGPLNYVIDGDIRADYNAVIRVGTSAMITEVLVDASCPLITVISVSIINLGLASATFRVRISNCGPGLPYTWGHLEGPCATISPQKHHKFSVRLPGPPQSTRSLFYCSVEIVNSRRELLTVRRVKVQFMTRCVCVWHCLCACVMSGTLPKVGALSCENITPGHMHVAGIQGSPGYLFSGSPTSVENVLLDAFIFAFAILLMLLLLGLAKAVIGFLWSPPVGSWGLDLMAEEPKHLDAYYEPNLRSRPVVYDAHGYPVHPDTKRRIVRTFSKSKEFLFNLIFFVIYPYVALCRIIKRCICGDPVPSGDNTFYKWGNRITTREPMWRRHKKQDKDLQNLLNDNEAECDSRCGAERLRAAGLKEKQILIYKKQGDEERAERMVRTTLKRSQETLLEHGIDVVCDESGLLLNDVITNKVDTDELAEAQQLANTMLESRVVYREISVALGGALISKRESYCVRGYFLRGLVGMTFITPTPLLQYWEILPNRQMKKLNPPRVLVSPDFTAEYKGCLHVFRRGDLSLFPTAPCINVRDHI